MKNYAGKSRGFYQGLFRITNPHKYIGNKPPIYRSGWEADVCHFFDTNVRVVKWISEPPMFEIDYPLPDGSTHTYHPDFYVEMWDDSKRLRKFLVEVKPMSQSPRHSSPPKEPRVKKTSTMAQWTKKMRDWMINKFKWDATEKWLKKYHPDITFIVITEKESKIWGEKSKKNK